MMDQLTDLRKGKDVEKTIAFYQGQVEVCNHMLNRGEGPAYAQYHAMESLKFWENKRV